MLRPDDEGRPCPQRPVRQDLAQPPVCERLPDQGFGLNGDSHAGDRGPAQGHDIVRREGPGNGDVARFAVAPKTPDRLSSPLRKGEAVVLRKILGIGKRRPARQIGGAGAGDDAVGCERPGDEAVIGMLAGADGDVEALLDHIDHTVVDAQLDRDLRMGEPKLGDGVDQHLDAEPRRGADPQEAAWAAVEFFADQVGGLDIGQYRAGTLAKRRAEVGQALAPRGALDQSAAEAVFEKLDMLANHGARDLECFGRRRKAAELGDPHEDGKAPQIVHSQHTL